MPTPESATEPAPSVINWYFGPTAWDARPDALWHAGCADPFATGHDGEVWLDHHRGAFCSGCRRYEPGQAEQDISAERAAELAEVATQTTEKQGARPADPNEAPTASNAGAAEVETAGDVASNTAPAAPDAHPGILGRIEHALGGNDA